MTNTTQSVRQSAIADSHVTIHMAASLDGFFARTSAVLIGLSMAAVFPAMAVYEATRYRGSHNLIPFELLAAAFCTVPLMFAAWFGRVMARRAGHAPQPAHRPDEA
jgi:cation transporter-like permease